METDVLNFCPALPDPEHTKVTFLSVYLTGDGNKVNNIFKNYFQIKKW